MNVLIYKLNLNRNYSNCKITNYHIYYKYQKNIKFLGKYINVLVLIEKVIKIVKLSIKISASVFLS
jgi:hypothetical protein